MGQAAGAKTKLKPELPSPFENLMKLSGRAVVIVIVCYVKLLLLMLIVDYCCFEGRLC